MTIYADSRGRVHRYNYKMIANQCIHVIVCTNVVYGVWCMVYVQNLGISVPDVKHPISLK